jgi:periplasmic protein CpxP/Spy
MKLKNLSLIAAAFALSLTVAPSGVKAETTSTSPLIVAQGQQQAPGPRIQLSEAQKTEIEKIRLDTRTRIEKIFTPKQKKQLEASLKAGQPAQQALGSLKFSPEQQTQLRDIMQSSQQKVEGILTTEQKQQLLQMRQNRPQQQPQQQPQGSQQRPKPQR